MKEDFKRTTVVCAAVLTFLGGAYAGGSALVEAFTSAVKGANARLDSVGTVAAEDSASGSKTDPTPQSVLPKKFGISIER